MHKASIGLVSGSVQDIVRYNSKAQCNTMQIRTENPDVVDKMLLKRYPVERESLVPEMGVPKTAERK